MKKKLTRQWPRQLQSAANSLGPVAEKAISIHKWNSSNRKKLKILILKKERAAACQRIKKGKKERNKKNLRINAIIHNYVRDKSIFHRNIKTLNPEPETLESPNPQSNPIDNIPILRGSLGFLNRNMSKRIVLRWNFWKPEERACCNSFSSINPLRSLSTAWKFLITSGGVPGGKLGYADDDDTCP